MSETAPKHRVVLSSGLLAFMSVACGLTVANLYYNQPLLTELRMEFGVSIARIGHIPTLTQLGYACGMLFLTPLGDKHDRKKLLVLFTFATCAALLITAMSSRIEYLELGSFLVGLSAVGAQIVVPHVAELSRDESRGEAVGKIMTGLLLGILLARTLSGFAGSIWGWRSVYVISASLMAILAISMMRVLPPSVPSFQGSYLGLLKSMARLTRREPVLRQSALMGACLFGAFSTIWATLVFLLESEPFHLGAKTAGAFGLLGAAGAISSAVVGRAADRRGPLWTLRVSLVLCFFSFALLGASRASLVGLIVGIFFMDAGVQAAHVSNQSRFFKIRPEARSRMNTVYMFCYFVGGALGSWLAALLWKPFGWRGVCALGLTSIAVALGVAFRPRTS